MLQHADAGGATAPGAASMKAVLHRRYGAPEVLKVGEVDRPVAGDDEVLVRVFAAGASIGDHLVVAGRPYLLRMSAFGGVPHPKNLVPGAAMSGRIEAVGARVSGFRVGDEVFGQAPHGAFAQYLAIPAKLIAHKPTNLGFEEAAAVPWGTTALQALRDAGGVAAGDRVLIHGASGAVGAWAVQIAKSLGAHVTAVCSTRSVALVRSLGADEVIDRTQRDFLEGDARYDVFLDLVGNRPLSRCKRVLGSGGRYVACSVGDGDWIGPVVRLVGGQLVFLSGGRRMVAFMQKLDAADLVTMRQLVESGAIRPIVEKVWPLADVAAALRHVGSRHSQGSNVLHIASAFAPES